MLYPVNLNLNGKKCLIVGGGEVATRKISSLIETGAKITIISPVVTEKINELVKEKKIIWIG
jgi:precorrin-2 dehydrogenase/sirohydrochlorin ferrochelatase